MSSEVTSVVQARDDGALDQITVENMRIGWIGDILQSRAIVLADIIEYRRWRENRGIKDDI